MKTHKKKIVVVLINCMYVENLWHEVCKTINHVIILHFLFFFIFVFLKKKYQKQMLICRFILLFLFLFIYFSDFFHICIFKMIQKSLLTLHLSCFTIFCFIHKILFLVLLMKTEKTYTYLHIAFERMKSIFYMLDEKLLLMSISFSHLINEWMKCWQS